MTHFEDKGECFELIFLIYHSQEHIATPDALARLFVPQVFYVDVYQSLRLWLLISKVCVNWNISGNAPLHLSSRVAGR